jgi:acetyl esterase/lipase
VKIIRNLRYRAGSDRGLLDLFTPEGDGPFPAVVCLHGGGWSGGDKQDIHGYAPFLTEIGIAAICANYRLTTTDPHPAQQEDVFAVLDWTAANASAQRLDPQRIGLTGASAGGHLTMLVGVKAGRRPKSAYTVRCMLPICGVSDVALWLKQKPQFLEHVQAFLGGPPAERGAVERDASPIVHVHRGAPPCLAIHGEADDVVPVNQSSLLVEALRKAGAEAEALILPDLGHLGTMPRTSPPEPLGGAKVFQEFFRKHLL